jgi:hypothetical protein
MSQALEVLLVLAELALQDLQDNVVLEVILEK